MKYIDLGLPSGTLWAERNEEGFYTFDDAVKKYGDNIPSKEQWEELLNECQWKWNGKGYNVTGHNGNMIVLSAVGRRNCGNGWSSTPYGSDYIWYIDFYSGGVNMYYSDRCYGRFVILVKK